MAVEIDTVLVPVDDTEEAERAVEYAVAIAQRYGASIHILHIVDDSVARAIQRGDIDADAVAEEHRAFMAAVRELTRDADGDVEASQSSAAGFSAERLSRHPVNVVLDSAEEIGSDMIVVPRESTNDAPGAMLGKVAQHVLSYASQPVLSV